MTLGTPPGDSAAGQSGHPAAGSQVPDETEFTDFYRATAHRLIGFLITQGAQLADAAEIAQDAFEAAWQQWPQIENRRAWIFKVASRKLIKGRLEQREHAVEDIELGELLGPAPSPEPVLAHLDLLNALNQLAPRPREVIAWSLAGFTSVEIARELGMSPGTVRTYLARARQQLSMSGRLGDESESAGQPLPPARHPNRP
jgi:RNA polymerase sigma-70 factor (ECF subfamily)